MSLPRGMPDGDVYSIIAQIYLYVKDTYEGKYEDRIKKGENNGVKNLKDPKAFTECLNNIQIAYKNIEEYNSSKKRNVLIAFGDMIADMISNIQSDSN